MIPLSSAASAQLSWSKLPHNRGYELRWNREVMGTLHHPSLRSPNFMAETPNGCWTFRRGGFLGAGSDIVDSVSQQQVATFRPAWNGGGALIFADGEIFHVACKGLWHPVWSVATEEGQPVLYLHTREKSIELPSGTSLPESRLSLLIIFSWYRLLQAEEDVASAAMVA